VNRKLIFLDKKNASFHNPTTRNRNTHDNVSSNNFQTHTQTMMHSQNSLENLHQQQMTP
jgi:hypothetical protein